MRVHRAKLVRKYLRFYRMLYGIEPPYCIILDGNFIFAALKHKIDILDRMQRLLQGAEVKLFVTRSSLNELSKIGESGTASLSYANEFCTILEDGSMSGITSADKLLRLLDAENALKLKGKKYFVATQDKELRIMLGKIPGIPLLYLNKVILVLEPPSSESKEHNREVEQVKTALTGTEAELVTSLTKKGVKANLIGGPAAAVNSNSNNNKETEIDESNSVVNQGERRKRKAKAANPLSCAAPDENSNRQKKLKLKRIRKSA